MLRFLQIFMSLTLFTSVAAPSAAQAPSAGHVVGRVVDGQGNPVAGAEIFIGYQSLGGGRAGRYGASHSRTGRTGPDGRYRIHIGNMAMGEYAAFGKAHVEQDGERIEVDLTPENPDNFANNAATVRNFRLQYAETTPTSEYGIGGTVLVDNDIGDFTPREEVELILTPASGGNPIVRRLRNTGEGWVATGIPFGTYEVAARRNGRALLIKGKQGSDWGRSHVGNFKRYGPGIYQLRVEIRSR